MAGTFRVWVGITTAHTRTVALSSIQAPAGAFQHSLRLCTARRARKFTQEEDWDGALVRPAGCTVRSMSPVVPTRAQTSALSLGSPQRLSHLMCKVLSPTSGLKQSPVRRLTNIFASAPSVPPSPAPRLPRRTAPFLPSPGRQGAVFLFSARLCRSPRRAPAGHLGAGPGQGVLYMSASASRSSM